jgi:hypothetical protein
MATRKRCCGADPASEEFRQNMLNPGPDCPMTQLHTLPVRVGGPRARATYPLVLGPAGFLSPFFARYSLGLSPVHRLNVFENTNGLA